MPRRNNRKSYVTGKPAVFFEVCPSHSGHKHECVGCAFAGYGFVCKTSDGTCLKSVRDQQERGRLRSGISSNRQYN